MIVRGFCDYNNKKCECWPGYRGEDCGIEVECHNNCTSELHGKCLKMENVFVNLCLWAQTAVIVDVLTIVMIMEYA